VCNYRRSDTDNDPSLFAAYLLSIIMLAFGTGTILAIMIIIVIMIIDT
jgi:hypothetical protein